MFSEHEKVDSILNMKRPSNTSEVRWGLVTYCGKFVPDFATITEPLRQLTHYKADFVWNEEQESVSCKIKTFNSKDSVSSYFHPALKTKIVADASKKVLVLYCFKRTLEIVFFD